MRLGIDSFKAGPLLAGAAAVTVSVLLHVGLVRLNPDLYTGGGGRVARGGEQDRRELPGVRLEELPSDRAPVPFGRLAERYGLLEVPEASMLEDLPSPEPEFLPASEQAVAMRAGGVEPGMPDGEDPPSVETETDWRPGQEVMQISEEVARDDVAVLPRRVERRGHDVVDAPDILLPEDFPEGPLIEVDGMTVFPRRGVFDLPGEERERVPAMPALREMAVPTPRIPENSEWTPSPELTASLEESMEEVVAMEPVESLLSLRTQSFVDPSNPEYRYFKIQVTRRGIEDLPVMPRQVVLMIDGSSGMSPHMLSQAVEGAMAALETLSAEDTFNVLVFGGEPELLFEESRSARSVNLAAARTYLKQLRPSGAPDVFASLQALRGLKTGEGRPLIGLLVTNGLAVKGVEESTGIIDAFTRLNDGDASIFSVAAGRGVNRYLIDFLSYRNRGESLVAEHARQLPAAVEQTAGQVRRPVMSHLDYRFTGGEEMEIYPRQLSHLYLDRSLLLVGRVSTEREAVAFQIVGASESGEHDMVFTLDFRSIPRGPWALRQEWAWQALLHRIGEHLRDPDPRELGRIREFARGYGINLPYADLLEGE